MRIRDSWVLGLPLLLTCSSFLLRAQSADTPQQHQNSALTDTQKQAIVAEIQSQTNASIAAIQKKCGYNETETNDKNRRKANECINSAIRLRQQTIRLNDMLHATAQTEAINQERKKLAQQQLSPGVLQQVQQQVVGAGQQLGTDITGSGTPQAFVGGSLIGTLTTCGTPGNGINNAALIRVHRVVMTPQVAMDDFGYRLGRRYIVYQVTVENGSKDYQFMLQDVSVDFSSQYNKPAGTYSYSASGQDLTLLRGVPEKGEDLDPRNRLLHILQGIGSVAGAVSGLTSFSDVMGSSVAVFNGSFLQGYTTLAPDHTGTQLNRLSDSAFIANTVIDKQRAKTIAMFIPADEVLSHAQQKDFRKDPNAYLGFNDETQSLNAADVCVDGNFIQAVTVAAPTLSTAILDKPDPGANKDGMLTVAGSNLVAGDTIIVLGSGVTATRSAVITTDGKTGRSQVHLPTDYVAGTTTAVLQSTLTPSLTSGAGVKITIAP